MDVLAIIALLSVLISLAILAVVFDRQSAVLTPKQKLSGLGFVVVLWALLFGVYLARLRYTRTYYAYDSEAVGNCIVFKEKLFCRNVPLDIDTCTETATVVKCTDPPDWWYRRSRNSN